jgi:hypothetical protein
MAQEVLQVFPDYDGSFMLGGMDTAITGTFTWHGIEWTASMIVTRFAYIGLAVLVTLLGALFFDRFDPSRRRPRRMKKAAAIETLEAIPVSQPLPAIRLTPLGPTANQFRFTRVLLAELKLMLKGQYWWWYLGAAGLIIASLVNPIETARQYVLPLAWIWPILLISSIGNREARFNMQQIAFSSASPLWRQLPAQWIAGFIVILFMGSGAALKFLISGNVTGLIAFVSGALFIPSLALALGVWSGSSKPFEIVYVSLWYLGPLNKVPGLDFIGAQTDGRPEFFIPLSLALLAFAFLGRARQLRN